MNGLNGVFCGWCDEALGDAPVSTVTIAKTEVKVHADCAKCSYCQKPGSGWRVSEFACDECSDDLDRGDAMADRERNAEGWERS